MKWLFVLMLVIPRTILGQGLEIPSEFEIPDDPVGSSEFRLVIAVAATPEQATTDDPMRASVIVEAIDGGRVRYAGSGTCVRSSGGKCLVLTCEHIARGVSSPQYRVRQGGQSFPAVLVASDRKVDAAVLTINGDIPAAVMASDDQLPQSLVSVGSGSKINHKLISRDRGTIMTDGQQVEGRSGGGLFDDQGRLVGVINGTRLDQRQSVYTPVSAMRGVIPVELGAMATQVTQVTFWTAPFPCPPCNRSHKNIGAGDASIVVTRQVGPAKWMTADWLASNPKSGYPFHSWHGPTGEMHVIYGCQTLDSLRAAIAEKASAAITEIQPEGQFVGANMIQSVLDSVRQYFPDGSKIKIGWQRVGGKPALLASGSHGLVDILGTSGRISVEAQGLSELPISKLGFGYRVKARKIAIKLDEIEFDLPGADTVSASAQVGNPLLIAQTILGAIEIVYDVFHPTIDVYLAEDIAITATIGQTCSIRFDRGEPAIRAHWAFFMGLLRVEYSRPLTGLTISADSIGFEFHKSRIYRDVKFPVKN
jgi:hypothetical protein